MNEDKNILTPLKYDDKLKITLDTSIQDKDTQDKLNKLFYEKYEGLSPFGEGMKYLPMTYVLALADIVSNNKNSFAGKFHAESEEYFKILNIN